MEQKSKTIIVTQKDRFIRFGYDWFEKFCMKFNTTIMVVNNEALSPQEELVQDIVSILHVFSCRLYGLRKYKKQIEKDGVLECFLGEDFGLFGVGLVVELAGVAERNLFVPPLLAHRLLAFEGM